MSNYTCLKSKLIESGILQITLNRPDKLNALSTIMLEELADLLHLAETKDEVKAILITGEGKAFCAGADISRLAAANALSGLEFAKNGQAVFHKLENIDKPSLAAINGYAFGGGCELAMATTMRIASENATFGQPEVKLGVIPGYGGTQRLARLVGKGRALDLCITGRTIEAKTAEHWGLITEICSQEQLLTRATEILNSLLELAPIAIANIIKVINNGYDLSLEDANHLEAVHFALCCATKDKQEGVNAFLEKRPASFTGE